jgi:hypothetical protein
MGRTLPSITQAFLQEQESFSRFRRALRRSDQLVLDDLFAAAHQHLAAAAYAAHALPFETLLLSMLLEEHKEIVRIRVLLTRLVEMQDVASLPAAPGADVGEAQDAPASHGASPEAG